VDLGHVCLISGEIIQAGIKPKQVVELGELLMVRDATREAATVDSTTCFGLIPA
jgi:hypothetical protein